jgi:hypothetical protein
MKNILIFILFLVGLVTIYFTYNLFRLAPQGHGSHANYKFHMSKFDLEKRIDSLIEADKKLERKKLEKPPNDNYYNEGAYFTIITGGASFCFRYSGNSEDWKNSPDSSEIFIASYHNFEKNEKRKKEYFKLIETNFIYKLGE